MSTITELSDKILSIDKYLKKRNFLIPNYQRGYKWGVPNNDPSKGSSLDYFSKSLIDAFNRDANQKYFIEAITAVEKNNQIILVDGQQRTTTLYLLFVALGEIEYLKSINFKLVYDIRKDSDNYLNNFLLEESEHLVIEDKDTQDIFYFKMALEKLKKDFSAIDDKDKFAQFMKDRVCLLYNIIEEDKAVTTFISLNGLKAVMKDEELIKSDLLIKSSRNKKTQQYSDKELIGVEWKINEDRNRLAHNWDKWLYWWNDAEVKKYFGTENRHPLFFLLVSHWNLKTADETKKFDFDNFKTKFIVDNVSAKNTFEELRKLQKSFEDLYNNPASYNYLGISLKTASDKEKAITYFLKEKEIEKQKEYAMFALVNATHLENSNRTMDKDGEVELRIVKAKQAIDLISKKFVYNKEGNEFAFRFLLLLNVIEDTKLKRKFNFNIWYNRSLEHIHPKSKVYHKDGENYRDGVDTDLGLFEPVGPHWLNRDKMDENDSEHSIGNLVLLYGRDNSSFGAKPFEAKKQTYFETDSELKFESKSLLHTLSIFASSEWNAESILKNKKTIISNIKTIYGLN